MIPVGIAYNNKLVSATEAPKTWKDVLDPKWKGKLIAADPGASGTGLMAFYYWEKTFGLDFIRQLAQNAPMVVGSTAPAANAVAAGERPVAAMMDSWEVVMRVHKDLPIAINFPKEGVPVAPSPVAVVAGSPNPNAAQLLMHYMISKEGQQVIMDDVGAIRPARHAAVEEHAQADGSEIGRHRLGRAAGRAIPGGRYVLENTQGRCCQMKPDWTALRNEFPTLKHWTYLDVARKTVPPRCQEQALQEYTRDVYENAGADAWSAENVAETRAVMAQLLGAKPAEIAFTKNTTEGLNIAAHGFDLKPGDNIVLTNLEHVANIWV